MLLTLTSQEQNDLIWQPGDFFEIVPGTVNFTSRQQQPGTRFHPQNTTTVARFFFDSADNTWGEREWTMYIGSEVPNGPALLVLYRRGNDANAFGLVSMTNGAWTHSQPIGEMSLVQDSKRYKDLVGGAVGAQWKAIALAVAATVVLSLCTFGCAAVIVPVVVYTVPSYRERFREIVGVKGSESNDRRITAAARGLMHRLAKNAGQFWPDQGGASGKL